MVALPRESLKAARLYLWVLSGNPFLTVPKPDELPDLEALLRKIDGVEMLRLVHRLGESGLIKLKAM